MQLLAFAFALLPLAQAKNCSSGGQDAKITSDSFFYGQSPPVYPTPEMNPNGTWAAAYAKALALIRQMTNEEKVNVTLGQSGTACTGATGGVPRLGYPGLCFSGSTAGIKQQELVNGYPGGVHSGASWNREMNRERAAAMAREFRAKGMHIQGAPLIGPLGRLPRGGRNNGGFSNDPYLAGQLAAMMVEGISSAGVVSTGKHFVGYEQETYRIRTGDVDPVSSNIDDRTMHELYLWPWADVVRAGMPAVMCSYNKLNNSQACQNSKALNGLLKGELGFQGWVMTDWFALTGGYVAAAAGLDAVMPSPGLWGSNGSSLVEAVQNGSLPAARLDDMAARILTPWFHLGQDAGYTPGGWGATAHFDLPHRKVNARDPASKEVMLRNAMEGHVLVKNANGALPLKKPQMLSVFGYDAAAPRRMNIPSPNDDGFDWSRGNESVDPNSIVQIDGVSYAPAAARNGTLVHAGWSESNAPAYIHAPFDAILEQAYVDGTSLWWDFESENPWVNANSDACLVFINAWATEGQDRSALQDAFSDNLVNNVAANCSNTMVFIHNNWIRLVDAWIDHPNVTAVLFAHLPGQDSGRSLAQLLYGHVSPSGKLPYTVAKAEEDYGDLLPSLPEGRYALYPQSHFSEGIYVDYRHFDKHNITPRFEFGFGLTYTTFAYSHLHVWNRASDVPERAPARPTQPGGNPALWEVVASVNATVENTGHFDAAEIAQLYVKIPGDDTPPRQLRGFDKQAIPAGGKATVSFSLTRRDLSVWDVVAQDWIVRRGVYHIYVGPSSRTLPLHTTLEF